MSRRRNLLGAMRFSILAAALACSLVPFGARAGTFSTVEPARISAGTFYNGATLHVRGSIGEDSQVVIRVMGPSAAETFNRRDKIGGIIWGGIEHVTFRHAPSLYGVYSSAAMAVVADPTVRAQLQLGYETFEAHMEVEGTQVDKRLMIEHFVRLKEGEGLYRVAPGAVHIEDAQHGRRNFSVAVSLAVQTPPGDLEVAVFELARGAVIREDKAQVRLRRIGLPAYLYRLAHEHGVLFGFLAVLVSLATGLGIGFVGSQKAARARRPAAPLDETAASAAPIPAPRPGVFAGLARGVSEALVAVRLRSRSPEDVARLHAKYRRFRTLLTLNNEVLELLAELEEESSWSSFRHPRVRMGIRALFDGTADMVQVLNELTGDRYFDLANVIASVRADVSDFLAKVSEQEDPRLTLQMGDISSKTAGQVGGKAVNLARLECDLGVRVPEFFVVTTEAYRLFLDNEGLAGKLRTVLAPARLDAPDDFRRRCELAQDLIREARVPPAVVEAIHTAARASGIPVGEGVAVRSSAAGEDSELSFAGQFETVLNVPESGVPGAWKRVVVSRFSPRAVFYRRAAGLAEVDTPMAVLVQRMVRARASGVLFTRRPDDPKASVLLITAVRGLGPEVSAGIASADEFVISRGSPHRILDRHIARKPAHLVGAEGGGLTQLALEAEEQGQAAIPDEEALRLAETALGIERYFGGAQDIEWTIDGDGELFILQARPLRTEKAEAVRGDVPRDAVLLLHGGEPVWPGRGVGPVHIARSREEEDATPTGALLVVPQLLPDCVRLLPRVCGIVVERGTVTGHAASIVREFRVPSLFGVAGALDTLIPGEAVSLDAARRSVFLGVLWPELRGHLPVTLLGRRSVGLPEILAGKLTKLSGSSFMGTWACQSLHDVIRFAHEMAIQAMFDIGDRLLDSPIGGVKRLECPPPLYMHLVDLGGGLRPEVASKRTVHPEDVASVPFQGLWRGLGDPQFERRRLDTPLRPFGSIIATTISTTAPRELGAPNYACITDSYLNLNSRQAYHFAIVDAFLSDNQNSNHISLRLKGGGGAPWQRNLRAEFVAEVLRLHHFTVNVTGDLLNGWARGLDLVTGLDKLATIGHLLRFLAQLDMLMTDEAHVKRYVATFVEAEAAALAARGAESGSAAQGLGGQS
ncbi:MAG: TIGR02186 family protein [Candidatus Methylomirabilota bacterium]